MIIQLETQQEETFSWILSEMIEEAILTHDRHLIRKIRRLWQQDAFGCGSKHGEKWSSILKKYQTQGNVWYVWWMDGVRRLQQRNTKRHK